MPAQARRVPGPRPVAGVLLEAAAPVAVDGILLEQASAPASHAVAGILLDDAGADSASWNAEAFAGRLRAAKHRGDGRAERRLLVEVANSNHLALSTWLVPKTQAVAHDACAASRALGLRQKWFGRAPRVTFSTMTTADAIQHYGAQAKGNRGRKVCALNFANGVSVGGGYINGAKAQEEDLCRRMPTLYPSLIAAQQAGLYPFGPSTCSSANDTAKYADVLYTKGLVMARGDGEEGFAWLPPERQATTSLVTAAAPNVPQGELYDLGLMQKTVESILLAPHVVDSDVSTLILGAWGCGAFGGRPEDIGELFAHALLDCKLGFLYGEVHFAIPARNAADRNTVEFRNAFARRGVAVADVTPRR